MTIKKLPCFVNPDYNPSDNVTESDPEKTERLWSDPASWENRNKTLPKAGDRVVIDATWNMIMDLNESNSPIFDYIEVNGRLEFKRN